MSRFALIGYGRIGRVHEAALAATGDELVSVVDPAIGRPWPPAFDGIDAVVVATPTPSHGRVVDDVRRRWTGPILVEKPLAASGTEAERLLADPAVAGLYHAAFGAEVAWAAGLLTRWRAEHGELRSLTVDLDDIYRPDDEAESRLVDSWVDGGINALSIVHRLLDVRRLRPAARRRLDTYQAYAGELVDDAGGSVVITTRWNRPAGTKRSAGTFADGAVLELDHGAMTGRLSAGVVGLEAFRAATSPARLVQHYVGVYRRLATSAERRLFEADVERAMHHLLFAQG